MKVIALPGLDGTGDLFRGFAAAAPEGFSVEPVAYPPNRVLDYAGHVEVARQHLPGQGPFLLLGESFSGPIAVRVAAEEPPGLSGLVLCNSFIQPPAWSSFRHLPRGRLFRASVLEWVICRYLAGRWTSPDLVAAVRVANGRVAPEVQAARMRAVLSVDEREHLARVRVPVLFLHGTRDRLVRESCLRSILAVKPETRVTRLPTYCSRSSHGAPGPPS